MTVKNYNDMRVNELRQLAKELGIDKAYKYNKTELVDLVIKSSPSYVIKNGQALVEKISVRKEDTEVKTVKLAEFQNDDDRKIKIEKILRNLIRNLIMKKLIQKNKEKIREKNFKR